MNLKSTENHPQTMFQVGHLTFSTHLSGLSHGSDLQSYAMAELGNRGIECDDTMKAQSLLQKDIFTKGESDLQSYVMAELGKIGIECDDMMKAQSLLQKD